MNKTVSSLALLMLVSAAAQAQTNVTMTLNVDHGDRVMLKYRDLNYDEVVIDNLQDGDNPITIQVGEYSKVVNVYAKDGFGLESCTYLNPGSQESGSNDIVYMKESFFDASADPSTNGTVWTVKTFDFADKRTASATFNVDDPAKVKVLRVKSNTEVNLVPGANTVTFIPAEGDNVNESLFSITSTDWERPLYKLLVNGSKPEGYSDLNTDVTISNEDVVTIEANYPDIDVPVKFTYTETAAGFVTKVAADGKEVDFDGNTANVKCGSIVEFWYDETDYKLNSISINGETLSYPWSPVKNGVVTEETVVAIDAVKMGTYKINVNVNDAGYVKLMSFEDASSIYYGGVEIPLQSGENNNVEVSDKRHFFSIQAKTRSKLVALSLNGVAIEQVEKTDYSGNPYLEWPFPIEMNEGDVLDITASGPVRDSKAVVYIDKIPEGYYAFDFNMNGYKPDVKDGYNIVDFDDNTDPTVGDLPFHFDLMYDGVTSWLYQNGESVTPSYQSDYSYSYEIGTVADNSVFKLFTQAEPQNYAVTFTVNGIPSDKMSVMKDYVTVVADPENGFTVLGPTAISIAVNDDTVETEVLANGTAVVPQEDGTYMIMAEAETTIEVNGKLSGVATITEAGSYDIVTLQGITLKRGATANYLDTLPSGIYIVNGKKVKL